MGLTSEQQLAVNKDNTNIIVSAGAGSGKTTVLKERVLRKLKSGVKISELVILTFTNNAASEMKERIRNIILNDDEVKDMKDEIDKAYITTFDSYAGSIVRKYNYLLNISKNFTITSSNLIEIEKIKILDNIFENLYLTDNKFKNFIKDFSVKDDKEIRKAILNIYNKFCNLTNKNEFINNIDYYYTKEYIDNIYDKYEEIIFNKRDSINELLDLLEDETNDLDKALINREKTSNFRECNKLDDLINYKDFRLCPNTKELYTLRGIEIKNEIKEELTSLKSMLIFTKKEVLDNYYMTYDYVKVISDILKVLDKEVMNFKEKNNTYEFIDISLKAIELVKNYPNIREEIKNSINEIMIDEYQDNNDIQEEFISLIENNNVYCVGDVKQSIYRFRNANPYIFKNKYDSYIDEKIGFRIDLNKNFRSRNEVVNNINLIFDYLMSDEIGGAKYKEEHQMIFGNISYNDLKSENYDMEILSYKNENKKFNKNEVEAFIIAEDIKNKIKNKFKVTTFVNNKMVLKDIDYSDIAILIDKSTDFELLKKILEYEGIPTSIYKDINIKDEDEIYILKNIINLLICIKDKKYDNNFKHYFTSISRSYLLSISDDEIYKTIINKNYYETTLFKKCQNIINKLDSLSVKDLLYLVIDEFDFYNKLIEVGNVEERLTKLEYFIKNSDELNNLGMDIYQISNYFEEVLKSDSDIKMPLNNINSNSVKIMTIHKSKGLEFNVIYLPYLYTDFTKNKDKSKFKLSNNYGIMSSYFKGGIGKTFVFDLEDIDERKEELSEKIRLFYVALTRAKEKIIMINSFDDKLLSKDIITDNDKLKIKSYSNILSLLKNKLGMYIKNIDNINLTKDYNLIKNNNYENFIEENNLVIKTKDIEIENEIITNKHFSKTLNKLIDSNLKENLEYGNYIHYLFEVCDFKNNNIDELPIKDNEKKYLTNFLNLELLKDIKHAKIYKEHEIYFEKDNNMYHGFIDLLLVYDNHIDIIDYKLTNIDSKEYNTQLKGYKEYIENKFNLKTNTYLYSVNENILKEVN